MLQNFFIFMPASLFMLKMDWEREKNILQSSVSNFDCAMQHQTDSKRSIHDFLSWVDGNVLRVIVKHSEKHLSDINVESLASITDNKLLFAHYRKTRLKSFESRAYDKALELI